MAAADCFDLPQRLVETDHANQGAPRQLADRFAVRLSVVRQRWRR